MLSQETPNFFTDFKTVTFYVCILDVTCFTAGLKMKNPDHPSNFPNKCCPIHVCGAEGIPRYHQTKTGVDVRHTAVVYLRLFYLKHLL